MIFQRVFFGILSFFDENDLLFLKCHDIIKWKIESGKWKMKGIIICG